MTDTGADIPRLEGELTDLDELAAARDRHWFGRSDRGFEVLTYDQGFTVLEHPDLQKGPTFQYRLDQLGIDGEARRYFDMVLPNTEGDYRKRLRTPLTSLFRPRHMARLRDAIKEIARASVRSIEPGEPIDLMTALCWILPSQTYCEMVSMPYDLAPEVVRIGDATLGTILTVNHARRDEAMTTIVDSVHLIEEHLEARRADLRDDFTSAMIRQQQEGLLTREELFVEAFSILQASVDNTAHQMANTFGILLEQPDRWAEFRSNPDLRGRIIEEVVRLYPRFGTVFRYVPESVAIEDLRAPAGSWIFVSARAGQRDPRVFDAPDEYRPDRPAKRPLMFGAGPYNCLGQNLARMEIEEAMLAVLDLYPDIELAEPWTRRDTNAVTETTNLRVVVR